MRVQLPDEVSCRKYCIHLNMQNSLLNYGGWFVWKPTGGILTCELLFVTLGYFWSISEAMADGEQRDILKWHFDM